MNESPAKTLPCPNCDKRAILQWTGAQTCSMPPSSGYEYRCGCGWRGGNGWVRHEHPKDAFRREWEAANKGNP